MRDLLIPTAYGNALHFPWLLVFSSERSQGFPHGMYFLTHGRNFSKFDSKAGFRICGHIKERADAIKICQLHNDQLNPAKRRRRPGYQLSKAKGEIDLSRLGQPKAKKPMLILPKDFKRTDK